jgi:predicted amidohydrolase
MEQALAEVSKSCRENQVAAIVGMEWVVPGGLENRAFVIAADGRVLGHQTKNQITPGGEPENYVPGSTRRMFDIGGVKAGIVICHEGWRYPETVRWAAVRGAQIVFQPQVTGSDEPAADTPKGPAAETPKGPAAETPKGPATETPKGSGTGTAKPWGQSFYEMAMQCRAQENTVFFASVNRAMTAQNSATSLIDPAGNLMKFVPRGDESLLVADLDLTKATGFYAKRYLPKTYEEDTSSESGR